MIVDLGMTDSIEEAGERLVIDDFDTWDMTGYYLYSKLLRSGVSGHIGTWGTQPCASCAVEGVVVPERRQSLLGGRLLTVVRGDSCAAICCASSRRPPLGRY